MPLQYQGGGKRVAGEGVTVPLIGPSGEPEGLPVGGGDRRGSKGRTVLHLH